MPGTMDKVKDALHIGKKKDTEPTATAHHGEQERGSVDDEELAAMDPDERARYLKEYEEAEKDDNWTPKQGSLLDRLIAKGNKKTEDDLAEEARLREQKDRARQAGHLPPGA